MKRLTKLLLIAISSTILLTGCSSSPNGNSSSLINVVSREDGSGTRGAFTEITGILEKDDSGNEVDLTYDEAIIQNSTNGVITTIQGDKNAIGYISLGSVSDNIKTLKVDGISPETENIKDGSYKLSRPFNIAYNNDLSDLGKDFINFILSNKGQDIVEQEGYTKLDSGDEYSSSDLSGTITIAGSTSVSPVMEKLAESYMSLNKNIDIEIQATGSSAGIQSVLEKTVDIGMASRNLKDSEVENLSHLPIAIDGIAVIVNNENKVDNISMENIKKIFTGKTTTWEEIMD